jgi:hypothetical protein
VEFGLSSPFHRWQASEEGTASDKKERLSGPLFRNINLAVAYPNGVGAAGGEALASQ